MYRVQLAAPRISATPPLAIASASIASDWLADGSRTARLIKPAPSASPSFIEADVDERLGGVFFSFGGTRVEKTVVVENSYIPEAPIRRLSW